MTENHDNKKRIVIFRTGTGEGEDIASKLYEELKSGHLRQGWGAECMSLLDKNGEQVPKSEWEKNYEDQWNEPPTKRRYSALASMLQIEDGDVVIMPKMPAYDQFSIARASGKYTFENKSLIRNDFGHIIPVYAGSVRTFNRRANDDAYAVGSLFPRANHRYPVTFAYDQKHIDAAIKLLQEPQDSLIGKSNKELIQAALDGAIEKAAEAMKEEVKSWNGPQFEKAVRTAFENQGYETLQYRRYDGKGADVDIVVRPPSNNYSLFMPEEIAVQVKWKQGLDKNDIIGVKQLACWSESDTVQKFLISSADRFTNDAKKKAEAEGIILIGGLNTMYFLMGVPNPIRETD